MFRRVARCVVYPYLLPEAAQVPKCISQHIDAESESETQTGACRSIGTHNEFSLGLKVDGYAAPLFPRRASQLLRVRMTIITYHRLSLLSLFGSLTAEFSRVTCTLTTVRAAPLLSLPIDDVY